MPKDLRPPAEVTNLRGLAEKNRFLLKWQNPNDLDLGGIVIIRNENCPIAAKALTTGKEYYPGDLPFGQEKGEVVYASFQEDFDPEMVEAEFSDDYVEPDIEYYYNECYWGVFSRTIVLPINVKGDLAHAKFQNGVLFVSIPKQKIDNKISIEIVDD